MIGCTGLHVQLSVLAVGEPAGALEDKVDIEIPLNAELKAA